MKYKIVLSNTRFKPSFMSLNFPDLHAQTSLPHPAPEATNSTKPSHQSGTDEAWKVAQIGV